MHVIQNEIPIVLGTDDNGRSITKDLGEVKHLLIAGHTGCGKSTLLKCIIKSLNAEIRPRNSNLKTILIDTKDFDFKNFAQTPVITDAAEAVNCLKTLNHENADVIVIIDELSDLIAISDEFEELLMTLAQNSKVHIIAATGRPNILSGKVMDMFSNRILFTADKVADAIYSSAVPCQQIHIQTKA